MTFSVVENPAQRAMELCCLSLEIMVALSVTYSVATAASLCIAAFASVFIMYASNTGFLGKVLSIPVIAFVIANILSLLLQAITCSTVQIGSTVQGNLLFLILIPLMWLLYSPSDAQTLPYMQRIVTSVLDSYRDWEDRKSVV